MLPALAGANLIYGLGLIELGMTVDYAQLMIDADIANMILYSVKGIPVNDDTLSVEAIHKVGAFKDFLTHRSTFDHRKSQSQPALIDRRMRDTWLETGALTMTERALAKAKQVIETHQPLALSDSVKADLRSIVTRVEKEKKLPISEC